MKFTCWIIIRYWGFFFMTSSIITVIVILGKYSSKTFLPKNHTYKYDRPWISSIDNEFVFIDMFKMWKKSLPKYVTGKVPILALVHSPTCLVLTICECCKFIPFDPDLLIKSRVWVHFLVELIYGGFWEILRCPSHSVTDLRGF